MNPSDKDKNYDELISSTFGRNDLRFDFDKWKQNHTDAFREYQSKTQNKTHGSHETVAVWRTIMKSRFTKLATAAVIIVAVIIGLNWMGIEPDGATVAYGWSDVVREFRAADNIHIVMNVVNMFDKVSEEYWIKMPGCIRSRTVDKHKKETIIDNGIERLTISDSGKKYRFAPSNIDYEPVLQHRVVEVLDMFRGGRTKGTMAEGIKINKNESESTEKELIFDLDYEKDSNINGMAVKETGTGKAWVSGESLLPRKFQMAINGNGMPLGTVNVSCDYDPIPDSIFAMEPPEGYRQLPRKYQKYISGKVLSEQGKTIDGAIVYADKASIINPLEPTGPDGRFAIKMPPIHRGIDVGSPVLVISYDKDDLSEIGWCLINRSSKDYKKEAGYGKVVLAYKDDNSWNILEEATDLSLKMQPARRFSCRVTDRKGNSIANAAVSLNVETVDGRGKKIRLYKCPLGCRFSGQTPEILKKMQTNGRGVINAVSIPDFHDNTTYEFKVEADGYMTERHKFSAVDIPETNRITIQMYSEDITVTGLLIDNYGKPLGCRYIWPYIDGERYGAIFSDKDGRFTARFPKGSDIKLKPSSNAFYNPGPGCNKGKYPETAFDIDCSDGNSEYDVRLEVVKPEMVINIEVADSSGKNIPGIKIKLHDKKGFIDRDCSYLGWRITDEAGQCSFKEVPERDDLYLSLSGKDYHSTEVSIEYIDGEKRYNVRVVLQSK